MQALTLFATGLKLDCEHEFWRPPCRPEGVREPRGERRAGARSAASPRPGGPRGSTKGRAWHRRRLAGRWTAACLEQEVRGVRRALPLRPPTPAAPCGRGGAGLAPR